MRKVCNGGFGIWWHNNAKNIQVLSSSWTKQTCFYLVEHTANYFIDT